MLKTSINAKIIIIFALIQFTTQIPTDISRIKNKLIFLKLDKLSDLFCLAAPLGQKKVIRVYLEDVAHFSHESVHLRTT